MKKCNNCGSYNNLKEKHCYHCGKNPNEKSLLERLMDKLL